MSKRILIAALLTLAVGSNAVLAADETVPQQTTTGQTATTDQVTTTLYQDNPAVTSYEQLNP